MMIVSVVVVGVMFIVVVGAIYIVRKKKYAEVYEDWEKEYGPHRISYKNLYKAAKGFKDKEVIGQGGFGKVYKGVLPSSNEQIAIKRVAHDSGQGMEPGELDLVDWVIECWKKGSIHDAGDPRLEGIFAEEQMELILKLDLFYSHPNPAIRPSMSQVMQYLDGDAKFPDISPDTNVIGAFTAGNEASDSIVSFSSLFESSSSHTMSTFDSIRISGR